MSNYRRTYIPGGHYFFTVVTYKRRPFLCSKPAINRLRQAFKYTIQKKPFQLTSIVILPDHLHCMWELPDHDTDFPTRWNLIKHYFSIGMLGNTNQRREKDIWQHRYWEHAIRNERDWQKHLDYIYCNPVKHGYAKKPFDWAYSSFKQDVLKGFYEADWGATEPMNIKDMEVE